MRSREGGLATNLVLNTGYKRAFKKGMPGEGTHQLSLGFNSHHSTIIFPWATRAPRADCLIHLCFPAPRTEPDKEGRGIFVV